MQPINKFHRLSSVLKFEGYNKMKANTLLKKIFNILIIGFIFLSIYSCEDKWKQPASVSFLFQFNNPTTTSLIKLDWGSVQLKKLVISGNRNQGTKDITLEKNFDSYLQVNLSQSIANSVMQLDIPQGTYTKLNLSVEIVQTQNTPALVIKGKYIDSKGDTIPVRFEFSSGQTFNFIAKTKQGSNEIVLIEGTPATATVFLSPDYWFDTIDKKALDSALLEKENGTLTLLINKEKNTDIYKLIVERITGGNFIVFN